MKSFSTKYKRKQFFETVNPNINFPLLEEKILAFWKKENTFEKSLKIRPKNKSWNFLDGPPFITGLPHYGSLLSSIPKDLFPRYKTMQGYRVRRVWGWDCHGLPVENKVEGKLGIKSKKEIEQKVGVKRFVEECKTYVTKTSSEWEWYIDHIGRWVDFKNAYRTMDIDYMETVMWVFRKMYEKGYIYKGLRVSLYCPHCSTPISNFEVAMDAENYREVSETSSTYKFELRDEPGTYFLAWSTTPWNKLVTTALAVNPKFVYVKVKQGKDNYILAKNRLAILKDESYKILEEIPGQKLVGKSFTPLYKFFEVEKGKKAFVVIGGDFVTAEEGTGIVTIAPYGEEDLDVMQKENIQIVLHVDDEGIISKDSPIGAGLYYLDADRLVNEDLAKRGLLYREDPHTHSVAHCWRCQTRLFYNPLNAWFVDVQRLKPALYKNNKFINWIPKHFKYGRFLKSMQSAPDWCISRNRYWGSPVPVWECESHHRFVPGSIKELEEVAKVKIKDLHKPEIDEIVIKCQTCGKIAKRTPEVLDSWIEAGSAPYAERHFPFEKGLSLNDFFPSDFISEYTGQIRAWFYVLHVIATALFDSHAFKNVLVSGVILGTDGRKMSKNYGNYPDPRMMLQTYGGDALRLYLMGSPVMKGEDIRISAEEYRNQVKGFLLILWNVYNFFVSYANANRWRPNKNSKYLFKASGKNKISKLNILDRWILAMLYKTINTITTEGYESYNTIKIVEEALLFLSNLSHWYIRLSRDRIGFTSENKKDKNSAFATLYFVLKEYIKIIAPLIPFVSEEIYRNLTKEESVHLVDWPSVRKLTSEEEKVIDEMATVRGVVELTHSIRKKEKIPLRQPLKSLFYSFNMKGQDYNPQEYEDILKKELNVKDVYWGETPKSFLNEGKWVSGRVSKPSGLGDIYVSLRVDITPELVEEAKTRELIRKIQATRKKMEVSLTQKIKVSNPWLPENSELIERIKKITLAETLEIGEFSVRKA